MTDTPPDDDLPGDADPPTEAPSEDAADEPDAQEPGPAGHVAGGPGAALAEIAPSRPPRPPKRTGVFLDPDDLRVHVGDLLRTFLGGYQVDAYGNYTFTHEDARVFVTVGGSPIGPQVGVFSITNLDVDLTPELANFLLSTNHQLSFGAFSYDHDASAVWLKHTLLGSTLDGPELQSAVAGVASAAAHFDDQIRDRFGGRAFHDAPEDVQQRARPPEPDPDNYPSAGGYL
ncbi:MAG: YbjN domain-containing protein [Nitriliruptorales bacterium]|nr:YbjN domain-containing protein [Nitriliruptorales bacterium]